MDVDHLPEPSIEVERELEKANSQLALYAHDLKKLLAREAQKARELAAANDRLRALTGELEQSNDRVTAILNSITDAFIAVDGSWQLTYVNKATERLVARPAEQLIGKILWEELSLLFNSTERKQLEEGISSDRAFSLETFSGGLDAWLDVQVYPWKDGLSLYLRDVTERKTLEKQLLQAQKMEVVGRLASGVGHDFNNILTVISGNAELALGDLPPDDPTAEALLEITEASRRAANLTRQLLAFSRKQILQPKVLDLNSLVGGTEKMLRRLIGEDIKLRTRLQPNLGAVKADPGQIEQILMNLAVNARDAMPKGGELVFETENIEMNENESQERQDGAGINAGRYVKLTVTDTGHGMDDDTQSRIFEPFFTTKGEGKGTGLGLATVYGIVKQSSGYICVDSELEKGTSFKVCFPHVDGTPERTPEDATIVAPSGGETIMVVEDDATVLKLARSILERAGYNIICADNGVDALRLIKEHPGPIHLVLTDVIMPEMSGRALADSIQPLRRGLPVLYTSGYTDDAILRHGVLESGAHILGKPYSRNALLSTVRKILRFRAK